MLTTTENGAANSTGILEVARTDQKVDDMKGYIYQSLRILLDGDDV